MRDSGSVIQSLIQVQTGIVGDDIPNSFHINSNSFRWGLKCRHMSAVDNPWSTAYTYNLNLEPLIFPDPVPVAQ